MSQQNDKGSIALSPVFQKLNSPPSPRNKKFLVPALDGDRARVPDHIIGSCTNPEWSKLFMHPAEDTEPDEQPSTVDMSAFKGSPSTTKVPYSSNEPWSSSVDRDESESDSGDESDNESSGSGSDHGDDSGSVADGSASSSSSSDEDDSSGRDGNSSDDECDSNSNCSSSSSESGSSYSSCSRSGSPVDSPQQTFSIRETNFEQGGLKLKISATSSRLAEEPKSPPVKENLQPLPAAPPQPQQAKAATPSATPEKKPVVQSPSISRLRPRKKEEPKGVAAGSTQQVQQRAVGKRGQELLTHAAGPSSARNGQPEVAISQLAQELSGDALQEINQEDLAAILPDISTAEGPNEDVAGPPFDGFEDVTNLANKAEISAAATSTASAAAPTSAAAQEAAEEESSSEDNDMLPETVVSEAIQRIDVDDDNTSCTDGGRRSGTRADSYSSDDEDEGSDIDTKSARTNARMYSSRLLQQYEQTLLSQGDTQKGSSQSTGGSGETKAEQKESKSPRQRRSKSKKEEPAEEATAKSCPLEIDSYIPLDCCNVSNVSPDSGIQSVAGSPVHQSCSPASNQAHTSPHHSTSQSNYLPATKESSPILTETKKRPGRPAKPEKKSRGRPKKGKSVKEVSVEASVDAESPNCQARRGRGRPKKSEEAGAPKKPVPSTNKVKIEPVEILPQKRIAKAIESKDRMAKKSKERTEANDDKSDKSRNENPPRKKRWRQKNVKALTIPFPIKDTLPETLPISINYKRSKSGRKHKKMQAGKNKKMLKQGHKFTHNKVQPKKKMIVKKSVKGVAFKKLKKKKKASKDKQPDIKREDPAFISRLEEVLMALAKCTISKSLALPAPGENRLPSIFRVKRLLKKRKGSERSKNSDRDSENDALPPKSPHSSTKEKTKRKAKKSAVEVPKRAEPNEQRLPLKKRHYHLPSQQQPNSDSSQDQTASSAASATKTSQTSSSQAVSTKVEKASGSTKASRNSIDEAIESCISRFNPALNNKEESDATKSEVKKKIKLEATVEKTSKSVLAPVALLSKRAAALKASTQITATITNTPSNEEKEKEKEKSEEPAIIKREKEDIDLDDVPLKDLMNKKNKKKINLGLSKLPVVKLLEQNLILKKAVDAVKKKAKRRKAINRTGFPVKKKKKPKKDSEPTKLSEVKKENAAVEPKDCRTRSKHEKEVPPPPAKKSSKRKREASVTDAADNVPLIQRVAKRLKTILKDEDATTSTDGPAEDAPEPEGKGKQQPRWRKKFLVAGLFSDYYKEDEPRKTTPAELSKARNCVYKKEEHKHGLLPPPYHCGKFLRQRRVDFELPYDLWWQHQHNKLPGRDSEVPSWNYKKIRTNVYYDMKTPYMYEAHQACNCSLPQKTGQVGCGDDCINRLVYAECVSRLCPCKEKCSNQKIQKHEWAPGVEKFMTKEKGWGVRTKKTIKSGDFIMEYVGEVVSEKEFKNRMETRYSTDTHHYCLHLDGGLVIDGHRMGGECRFVNHSCEPNCEMQKWSVNGLFRMALFALKDIEAGEELGYDYNFSLFNAAEGQPCKCGNVNCRGVIGGKYQRVNPLIVDPKATNKLKKDGRKSKKKLKRNSKMHDAQMRIQMFAPMKPMSHQQRCFAQEHHCFLLRNLEKLKRFREKLKKHATEQQEAMAASKATPTSSKADVFLAQLNALSTPRSVRTRRLAQAEDNPELNKVARLAYVFKDLYQAVTLAKNESGEQLCLPFMTLPSKKKASLYFERIQDAIDLSIIDKNITSGTYTTVENFDQDFCRLFSNNMVFYGRSSELGIVAARLKKIYNDAKQVILPQLEDILGEMPPASFYTEKNAIVSKPHPGAKKMVVESEEDVIRCICGMFMDEGLMIQCEKCLVWQHGDCVKADSSIEHYLCEQCNPRVVNRDIIMNPKPDYPEAKGETYYISLMREELQLRIGDTVYVLRDIDRDDVVDPSMPPLKHTYKTLKNAKPEDCDIFKIERLFIDNGQRFAFGHHYLRPHETFHEPTRRFFPNEVMRIPLYEKVSFDLILDQCWVLDLPTYCKGRPLGAKEEHVYICEFRIDKTARLFTRLPVKTARQSACQFSMKTYAFESFESKLKPVRVYTPHPTDCPAPRPKSKARDDDSSSCKMEGSKISQKRIAIQIAASKIPPAVRRANQICRLNSVLVKLLDKQKAKGKETLDVTYLLEPNKRQRKKPVPLQSS